MRRRCAVDAPSVRRVVGDEGEQRLRVADALRLAHRHLFDVVIAEGIRKTFKRIRAEQRGVRP
jgi:hypothetical protein